MKKEKFLITGGAGYLGSVLTRELLVRGHQVTCLDNLRYRQDSPLVFCHDDNYELVVGDVRDEPLMRRLIRDKDIIIPLAAIVGMPACDKRQKDARTINRDAVVMLGKMRSHSQRLIFPNTNSGYGAKTGEVHCDEETPLEPISVYGTTKCEAERALLDSSKDVVILRLATVFGVSPRMRLDLLVNDFVWQAMTAGKISLYEPHFKRNYIGIQDAARAFVHANENFCSMKNRVYNVGLDNANLSKFELAIKIKVHFPNFKISTDGSGADLDRRNYIVSNRRIRQTGFLPQQTLDQGIVQLAKAYSVLIKTSNGDPSRFQN